MPCHPCYDFRQPPADLFCPVDRACLLGVTVEAAEVACRSVLNGRLVEDMAAATGAGTGSVEGAR